MKCNSPKPIMLHFTDNPVEGFIVEVVDSKVKCIV